MGLQTQNCGGMGLAQRLGTSPTQFRLGVAIPPSPTWSGFDRLQTTLRRRHLPPQSPPAVDDLGIPIAIEAACIAKRLMAAEGRRVVRRRRRAEGCRSPDIDAIGAQEGRERYPPRRSWSASAGQRPRGAIRRSPTKSSTGSTPRSPGKRGDRRLHGRREPPPAGGAQVLIKEEWAKVDFSPHVGDGTKKQAPSRRGHQLWWW